MSTEQSEWSPPTGGIVACGAIGGAIGIGSVIFVTDTPGRLFTGIAALGLIMFTGGSWRARPKLAITQSGLVVRGWLATLSLQRSDITMIRITEFRRIGRKVRLLEIETSHDQLLIFSRWDLGTDPLNVLDALIAAGYKF